MKIREQETDVRAPRNRRQYFYFFYSSFVCMKGCTQSPLWFSMQYPKIGTFIPPRRIQGEREGCFQQRWWCRGPKDYLSERGKGWIMVSPGKRWICLGTGSLDTLVFFWNSTTKMRVSLVLSELPCGQHGNSSACITPVCRHTRNARQQCHIHGSTYSFSQRPDLTGSWRLQDGSRGLGLVHTRSILGGGA